MFGLQPTRRDAASGRLTGKSDIFPTLNNSWACTPEEVGLEQPALLNPWLDEDDPDLHLAFDPDAGLVIGKTERGKQTVELLGLNREGLPEKRLEACRNLENIARNVLSDAAAGRLNDNGEKRDRIGPGLLGRVCRDLPPTAQTNTGQRHRLCWRGWGQAERPGGTYTQRAARGPS